jgi:multisubunit Na+/H+ antiporter MnhG subunit
MNHLDVRELRLHVSILGWLHIAVNSLFLLIAVFAFGLLPVIYTNVVSSDPDAASVLSILGTAFGTLMVVLGLPGLLAGYGLLKRKPWARFLALILGVLDLVNFPVGTAIGVYTLLVLLQQSATDYFAPQQPA